MNFLDDVKSKLGSAVDTAKDNHRAREEKAESDIVADPGVAGSRANTDDDVGEYVGRTNPQFDAETQESGAEARSEAARASKDET